MQDLPPPPEDEPPPFMPDGEPRVIRPGPRDTRVIETIWPPKPGTVKLARRFGPRLLCVRYRHDATGLRRYTTVELIIDEAPVTGRAVDHRTR